MWVTDKLLALARNDPRLFERTRNLRYLQPSELYKDGELADLGVVDVSFISLTKFCLLCGNSRE